MFNVLDVYIEKKKVPVGTFLKDCCDYAPEECIKENEIAGYCDEYYRGDDAPL